MIVLDIETSGFDTEKCGILQIGAIDLENTGNIFLENARLNEEYEIVNPINIENAKPVTEVIGMAEEEMRDKNKKSEKQLLENFFEWVEKIPVKNFLCQNPQFDVAFILVKARKYGLNIPFHHRSFDLHTIAQVKFHNLNNKFLIKENKSDMGLTNILEFCGVEDNRGIHNALEDCKLTGECFSRLIYGKNLFPEYSEFKIPEELAK